MITLDIEEDFEEEKDEDNMQEFETKKQWSLRIQHKYGWMIL